MEANVKFRLSIIERTIDLEYYGYDESTTWNELNESQQHEIEDSLREENIVIVSVSNAD